MDLQKAFNELDKLDEDDNFECPEDIITPAQEQFKKDMVKLFSDFSEDICSD